MYTNHDGSGSNQNCLKHFRRHYNLLQLSHFASHVEARNKNTTVPRKGPSVGIPHSPGTAGTPWDPCRLPWTSRDTRVILGDAWVTLWDTPGIPMDLPGIPLGFPGPPGTPWDRFVLRTWTIPRQWIWSWGTVGALMVSCVARSCPYMDRCIYMYTCIHTCISIYIYTYVYTRRPVVLQRQGNAGPVARGSSQRAAVADRPIDRPTK